MAIAFLRNHGAKVSIVLTALVPLFFIGTFFMTFGDIADSNTEVVEQFNRQITINGYIGLSLVAVTYLSSLGLAIYSIKREKTVSIISLFICIGYAVYFVAGI